MKILTSGFVIFVIWCFISAWLYNDKLLPAIRRPVTLQTFPEPPTPEADSLMNLQALMPGKLIIYFEFDKANLKPDPKIDSCIALYKSWIDKYPRSMVAIDGNTDLVGTPDYNNALGQKRALNTAIYLENRGIDQGRIITQSLGERVPVAGYITETGRARNRRTEISIKMQ